MKTLIQLAELTWPKAEEALIAADFCVLPCGSLEQHGFHLPLATDSLINIRLLELVAEKIAERVSLVTLPILSFGCSPEHREFPGTVSLPYEILAGLVVAASQSLARHGVKRLLLLNTHGGNGAVLRVAMREIRQKVDLVPYLFDLYESETLRRHASEFDLHAGDVETSLMLALDPARVEEISCSPSRCRSALSSADLRLRMPWWAEEFSTTGVIGNPQGANAQRGLVILKEVSTELAELLIAVTQQKESDR